MVRGKQGKYTGFFVQLFTNPFAEYVSATSPDGPCDASTEKKAEDQRATA